MRRIALFSAAALLLSACASVQPMDSIVDAPIAYACTGGRSFTVTYPASGKRARVSAGGVTKSLPLAASASGARYASGDYEVWSKGESATLKGFPGGPYGGCSAG